MTFCWKIKETYFVPLNFHFQTLICLISKPLLTLAFSLSQFFASKFPTGVPAYFLNADRLLGENFVFPYAQTQQR